MEHSSVNQNSRPSDGTRPLWARAVVLAAIWTIEDGLDAGARVGPLALATAIQPQRSG